MNILHIKGMSLEMAQTLIEGAMAKAREVGVRVHVAVVDESGNLKAFARMDGAPLIAEGIAKDKAFTAVSYGRSTDKWAEEFEKDHRMHAALHAYPRFVALGGGIPVARDGQIVGAIGVSGAHWRQDMEIAQAGITELENRMQKAA